DAHDLVLLLPKQPYRIRLHLLLRGRSYRASWNQQMARLFAYLDADGDGRLSRAELSHAPSQEQWRQITSGQALIDPDAAPDFAALSAGRGSVRLPDLVGYYAASTAGPLQLGWSWRPGSLYPASKTLWGRLDANSDGKLSRT